MRLLAGGRRIHAALAAGLTVIPALVRQVEDELDSREIELMENVFRKN
jgi:ParB-like chromosome segregation protein Spo0J